jgi:hypothetical protein
VTICCRTAGDMFWSSVADWQPGWGKNSSTSHTYGEKTAIERDGPVNPVELWQATVTASTILKD